MTFILAGYQRLCKYPADNTIHKESPSKQNAEPVLTTSGGSMMTHKDPVSPHGFSIREYTPEHVSPYDRLINSIIIMHANLGIHVLKQILMTFFSVF